MARANSIDESNGMDELGASLDQSVASFLGGQQQAQATPPPRQAITVDDDAMELIGDSNPGVPPGSQASTGNQAVQREIAKLTLKADKGNYEFNLDPSDKTLKDTLAAGVAARRYKAERDRILKEQKSFKEKMSGLESRASKLENLEKLASAGNDLQAVKELLGEERFKEFLQREVRDTIEYESGDEEVRSSVERRRKERHLETDNRIKEERIQELMNKFEEKELSAQKEVLHSASLKALGEQDFSKYISDKVLADKLNKKTWNAAIDDVMEHAERHGDDSITPAVINKYFAENARVFRAGLQQAAKSRANAIVDKKKEVAKSSAKSIMTQGVQTQSVASDWNGKSAKDLLKKMLGR